MLMDASEARYQRADIPRAERPIRLGSLLYTLVEPRRGHEVAYNRWYERDHFYAGCMIGEWQFAGRRFVATRDCKIKRYPGDSPIVADPSKGSYVAIYWVLDEHHDDWNKWGVEQVNRLHAGGRMFLERDHVHTALYRYRGEANAPGSHMPAELALDRAYPGMVTIIAEGRKGANPDRLADYFLRRACPADVMVMGTPLPLRGDRPADVPDQESDGRLLLMYFPTENPLDVWDRDYARIGAELEASGLGRVLFASPFLATVPGTDTYTDQLW
jgi:hypothetical protein